MKSDHANIYCNICNKFHQPKKHLKDGSFLNIDGFIKYMGKVMTNIKIR